jgi:hypothetical protein
MSHCPPFTALGNHVTLLAGPLDARRAKLQSSKLPTAPPRAFPTHSTNNPDTTTAMDTDMMDAGYDIDIDVDVSPAVPAQQPQQIIEVIRAQDHSRCIAEHHIKGQQ